MQVSPERFSREALGLVQNPENALFLSAASSWEIAIKYALGRLSLPLPPWEYVPSRLHNSGVESLPVHHSHALHLATLTLHHKDPFDRLLIAQAQLEGCSILTSDRRLAAYEVRLLWAT